MGGAALVAPFIVRFSQRPRANPAAVFFALALPRGAVQRGAMAERPSPRRGPVGALAVFALIIAGLMVFAPNLVGAWLGGLIGEIWATALGAITALFSGLFSGG